MDRIAEALSVLPPPMRDPVLWKFLGLIRSTKSVDTFNIWELETGEYIAMARDVRSATNWRDRLGCSFGPPGWRPARAAAVRLGG